MALETGGSLLAVATVALLLRQCGLRSRADHLWLTAGLVILAATSLAVAGMIVGGVWSPKQARYGMGGNLAGTLLLAIAAFAPSGKLQVKPWKLLTAAGVLALVVGGLASLLAGVGPELRAPNATWPSFHAEIGRVIVQVATAVALVVAAAGLTRRGEPLLRWVAVAVVLAGIAKLDYALFPPLGADSVHLGDILRVTAWGVLLTGVISEMRARVHLRNEAAIAGERRRLARELHDGVAQELALIRRRAGHLRQTKEGIEILSAVDRAFEDSRRAIEALVPPAHEPLDIALERLGARLAVECGVQVQVNVRVIPDISDEVRAELVRIICEAVRNAANHGAADRVRVELSGSPLAVRVTDNGNGFRDGANSGLGVAGYGLIAMRERAEQVGGKFSLESVRGAGTLVQVVLP